MKLYKISQISKTISSILVNFCASSYLNGSQLRCTYSTYTYRSLCFSCVSCRRVTESNLYRIIICWEASSRQSSHDHRDTATNVPHHSCSSRTSRRRRRARNGRSAVVVRRTAVSSARSFSVTCALAITGCNERPPITSSSASAPWNSCARCDRVIANSQLAYR